MQQSGEYRIGAPREAVWRALNDPDVLAQCIEGCEAMTRTGDDAFQAKVKARIGPLSATFDADVKLADLDPPNGYTLLASVKGGAAGFGKGTAKVALADDGAATVLRYDVDGSVGGKLAQVGQRLIDGAARKMADDFFAKFGEMVAPGDAKMLAIDVPAERPRRISVQTLAIIVLAGIAVVVVIVNLAGAR
jgi:carbon monoxide dehydrogenase subunit G